MPTAICQSDCGAILHWRNRRGASIKDLCCPQCDGPMTRAEWDGNAYAKPAPKVPVKRGLRVQCCLCGKYFHPDQIPHRKGGIIPMDVVRYDNGRGWTNFRMMVDLEDGFICWMHGATLGAYDLTARYDDERAWLYQGEAAIAAHSGEGE